MKRLDVSPKHGRHIDLDTVRETIAYMRDDLAGTPGFEGVAGRLSAALAEIDRLEAERGSDRKKSFVDMARFRFFGARP